jgi:hypothetical protein
MKYLWAVIIILFNSGKLLSQFTHDNVWVSDVDGIALKFNFTNDSINTELINSPYDISLGFSMCDSIGNFLFYSNGCNIINAADNTVVSGSNLNTEDPFWSISCDKDALGYPIAFGNICIPHPAGDNQYIIFHEQLRDVQNLDLLCTIVQVKSGEHVVIKSINQPLLPGDALTDQLMAVKHGNGRDWWLLVPQFHTNRFYRFLVTPEGISGPMPQDEGPVISHLYWGGQPCFSPDGKHYVRTVPREGAYLYDVDRCTGLLSFRELLQAKDTSYLVGASFSPNSRFLYVSPAINLYQFDLSAEKVNDSRVLVDKWDGIKAPNGLVPCFFQHLTGPNGEIYITTCQGTSYLHVIEKPDLPAPECRFVQRGIDVNLDYSIGTSSFPHYRLGGIANSPCDSIGKPPLDIISLYPNPSGNWVQVYVPYASGTCWEVFNTLGQFLGTYTPGTDRGIRLDVHQWPSGMYVIRGCSPEGAGYVKQFGVVR